jgi:2-polyprenyl-3-methyl-5-hydroxy-6-metoxy-1,4-benzoquinol methylase
MTDNSKISSVNQTAYDQVAAEYEKLVSKRFKRNVVRINYFQKFIKPGGKVLDIGCAVGMDVLHFDNLGYQITGIELSPKMVTYARQRNGLGTLFLQGLSCIYSPKTWQWM